MSNTYKTIILSSIILVLIFIGGVFAYKFREPEEIIFKAAEYKSQEEGIYLKLIELKDLEKDNLAIFMVSTSEKTRLELKSPNKRKSLKSPGFNTVRYDYNLNQPETNEMKINIYKKFLGVWVPDRTYIIMVREENLPQIKEENFTEISDKFLSQFENIGY